MTNSIRDHFNLAGKVAVVTGASQGIGAAIARGMAECGAKLVVSSRKQEAVDRVVDGFQSDGLEATAVCCHVGHTDQLGNLVDRAVDTYGGIDVLVNNAAANPVVGPAITVDSGAFDKIIDVNLKAPFELAKLVFPIMQQRGGGSIINVSSVGGLHPEPMLGIYSVSKAALISLTKVLAMEWGSDKVRVNAICPGLIKTKFSRALWENEEILKSFTDRLPLGRIATAEEVAPLALFLASGAASYCTGAVYTVDGGYAI